MVPIKEFCNSKIYNLASKKKNLLVYGNGNQIRSFCHVDDAVEGLLEIIKNGKRNTSYNIEMIINQFQYINLLKPYLLYLKKKSM